MRPAPRGRTVMPPAKEENEMVNGIPGDRRVAMLQQALGGLAGRQQAIAGNIANVDTPGYQRRDVEFEGALRASMGGSETQLATTTMGHIARASPRPSLLGGADGVQGHSTTGRNDGNDVDIDYEMTRMAETSLRYQVLTAAASSRFMMLKEVAR